jgi:type VI secretion system secreted protein Hcp
MAYDAFLNLDKVKGESQKANHDGQIDIQSFSWGCHNSSSVGTGTGVSVGKVRVSDFSITKTTDKSSPLLLQKCCDGSVIATGVVTLQRQVQGDATPYLVYNFTNLYVTSISCTGSGGAGDSPMESVSFCFEVFTCDYTALKDDGTPSDEGAIHGGWDIGQNVKA